MIIFTESNILLLKSHEPSSGISFFSNESIRLKMHLALSFIKASTQDDNSIFYEIILLILPRKDW